MTRETRRVAALGAVFCPERVEALLSNLSAGDALDGRDLARELAAADPAARLAALAEAFWPAERAGREDRVARLADLVQRERPQLAAALQALLSPPEARTRLPESSGPISPVLARLASEWS